MRYSVGSLLKLYNKIKSIDSGLDDITELSTARRAWSEVVDNIERGQSDGSSYWASNEKHVQQRPRQDRHF